MEDFDVTLSGDNIKVKMEENEDPLMCDSCGIYYAMISIILLLEIYIKNVYVWSLLLVLCMRHQLSSTGRSLVVLVMRLWL